MIIQSGVIPNIVIRKSRLGGLVAGYPTDSIRDDNIVFYCIGNYKITLSIYLNYDI
jgi:hypothetical protein